MIEIHYDGTERTVTWDEWEELVTSGKVPPQALIRFEPVTGDSFKAASELEMYTSLSSGEVVTWRKQFSKNFPPLMTALLVGVQFRIWWLAKIPGYDSRLVEFGKDASVPLFEDGEFWRLLTAGFLHTDWDHISMNMLWLAYTGWLLERAAGWRNLLLLYLGSVFGGALASATFGAYATSIGASGGVFGLIGATVIFGFLRPELLPEKGSKYFGFALLPYLIIMLFSGFQSSNTDNWAHVGGLFTGMLMIAFIDPLDPKFRTPRARGFLAACVGIFGLTALTLSLYGPALEPLEDETTIRHREQVRVAMMRGTTVAPPPPAEDRQLVFEAPEGWVSGRDLLQDPALVSPSKERSWNVAVREFSTPIVAADLKDDLLGSLERRGWTLTSEPTAEDTTLAGFAAVTYTAQVSSAGEDRSVRMTVVPRGRYGLRALWSTESDSFEHLLPLAKKLESTVIWRIEDALEYAREFSEERPESKSLKRRYARELAAQGLPEEAAAIWTELLSEPVTNMDTWLGVIEFVGAYPEAMGNFDEVCESLLRETQDPDIILALVEQLELRDQGPRANALLTLAWLQYPGEVSLQRALRKRQLPIDLVGAYQLPSLLSWDSVRWGPMPPDALLTFREPDISLAQTDLLVAFLNEQRRAAKTHLEAERAAEQTLALLALSGRAVTPLAERSLPELTYDLKQVSQGEPVWWWEDDLPSASRLLQQIQSVTRSDVNAAMSRTR